MKYIKQLDSLRAVAVILVIINHWVPPNNIINRIPNGAIGVDIFFVLSGFLISGILFDSRNKADSLNIGKSFFIKNFYIRRSLRIFPIYYLVIFAILLFAKASQTGIKPNFLYFATYTSNFYFFKIQGWDGMVGHLWSLAVEEQFYLIWPWIILFANKKYFLPIISVFILIGITTQVALSNMNMSNVLTFTCFDAFGIGAILAWVTTYAKGKLRKFFLVVSPLAAIATCFLVLGIYQHKWIVPIRTSVSFMTVWLLAYIMLNYEADSLRFKFILNNRMLIFLGKISYGIYLYHNIIPSTLNAKLINKYLNPLLPDLLYKRYWGQLFLVENIILVVFVSWLSFVLIEKRFLNLKKYFEYKKENKPEQSYVPNESVTA